MSSITSTCLVEFDGKPLPSDVVPLLLSAYVDDSQQLPDTFVLRFRDPHRLVLAAAGIKIGSLARVGVQVADGPQPAPLIAGEVTALEAEYDQSGTFTPPPAEAPGFPAFATRYPPPDALHLPFSQSLHVAAPRASRANGSRPA